MKKKILIILLIGISVFLFFKYGYKSIPNYTKESGSESVLIWDYNKYQEGYCLEENRILSDEEVFRKSLEQYFARGLDITKIIGQYRIDRDFFHGYKKYWNVDWEKYDFDKPAIGYYELEDVNYTNFNNEFFKKYNFKNKETGLLELFFQDFKANRVNPLSSVYIKGKKAYFERPLIKAYDDESFRIYKNCFLQDKNGYMIGCSSSTLSEGNKKDRIKYSLKRLNNTASKFYFRKVDNCGNIDYDVEKKAEELKEDMFSECTKHNK